MTTALPLDDGSEAAVLDVNAALMIRCQGNTQSPQTDFPLHSNLTSIADSSARATGNKPSSRASSGGLGPSPPTSTARRSRSPRLGKMRVATQQAGTTQRLPHFACANWLLGCRKLIGRFIQPAVQRGNGTKHTCSHKLGHSKPHSRSAALQRIFAVAAPEPSTCLSLSLCASIASPPS